MRLDRGPELQYSSNSALDTPFVSVIVPVFNDSKRLKICLRALKKQTYPKGRYEVIVVNNGSDEDVDSVVAVFKGFQVRTAEEDRAGSYAARNKGLSLAKGEVIAFTDSDCIPAVDWIEKGVENLLRAPNAGLIAGSVQLFCRNPNKPTAVELYDSLSNFPVRKQVEVYKCGPTANLFTLRSVFERVGLFSDKLKSRGDFEWGRRVYLSGHSVIYADNVRVAHPARYSFGDIYARTLRLQGGVHDFNRNHRRSFGTSPKGFLSNILQDLFLVYLHQELGLAQKAKVMFVMLSVKYVGLIEKMRLALGGESWR